MRIGKTPKKLDSICCPQHRETKADTLKLYGFKSTSAMYLTDDLEQAY
jgi:hypothetical protein